jgi:hypothetical protein
MGKRLRAQHRPAPGPSAAWGGGKEIAFYPRRPHGGAVTKLCIFAGTMVFGYLVGWMFSSFGLMTEVIASGFGSMIGVYVGWKFAQWIERG